MFNVGPMELMVLAHRRPHRLGPDKLPALARDAARMLRTLRELATGARTQLRDELGPEFADLASTCATSTRAPRSSGRSSATTRPGCKADLRKLDPREDLRD